jgi:hypothetical protein
MNPSDLAHLLRETSRCARTFAEALDTLALALDAAPEGSTELTELLLDIEQHGRRFTYAFHRIAPDVSRDLDADDWSKPGSPAPF